MGREPVAVRPRISGKVRGLDRQDEDTWPHGHARVILPPRLRHFVILLLKA